MLLGVALMLVSGVVLSFVIEVYTIAVCRLIMGSACILMFLNAYVLGRYLNISSLCG